MPLTTPPRRRAAVIGASMAGLSAAAVLSSRFSEVVIVERDELPVTPQPRRGVPQTRHLHALLPGGLELLEGWFPGLSRQLVAAGARDMDVGTEMLWFQAGGLRRRFASGVKVPVASRMLIEHQVRQRTLELPTVALRDGSTIAGLTTSPDGATVTGIRFEDGTTLAADLVVDATGRPARSIRWLADLGYEEPPTSQVDCDVAYASRILRRDPAGSGSWWYGAMVMAGPPSGRLGVVTPLEDGTWIVTLAGLHGDHPPRDDEGFLAFARSLPSPEVADLIAANEPLSEIVTHRIRSSQRRHPERLAHLPGGLVMSGDALCSFNPTYGQGMSTAALQAQALGRALDRVPTLDERMVRTYYRLAGKVVTPAWLMATGADFSLPATTGDKPAGTDLLNRYMPHVFRAAQVSEVVARCVVEVTSLVRPPQALLSPAMVARALVASRRHAPQPAPRLQPVATA